MVIPDFETIFFIGCIAKSEYIWPTTDLSLLRSIELNISPVDTVYPPTNNWKAPLSYELEMGINLNTILIVLKRSGNIKDIVFIKNIAMKIEREFSNLGKRRFNLNPGLINRNGLFLATHKPNSIRTKIGHNVWIEKQLEQFSNNLFPMLNTFDEYSADSRLKIFNKLLQNNLQTNESYDCEVAFINKMDKYNQLYHYNR